MALITSHLAKADVKPFQEANHHGKCSRPSFLRTSVRLRWQTNAPDLSLGTLPTAEALTNSLSIRGGTLHNAETCHSTISQQWGNVPVQRLRHAEPPALSIPRGIGDALLIENKPPVKSKIIHLQSWRSLKGSVMSNTLLYKCENSD